MALLVRVFVRGAVVVLPRAAGRACWPVVLRPFAARVVVLRVLARLVVPGFAAGVAAPCRLRFDARTSLVVATRPGRAVERVLRSTAGRYKLTDLLSTLARPGRLADRMSLTATLLRVARSISLRRGPVMYVRLLYTYVLLIMVVRLYMFTRLLRGT